MSTLMHQAAVGSSIDAVMVDPGAIVQNYNRQQQQQASSKRAEEQRENRRNSRRKSCVKSRPLSRNV